MKGAKNASMDDPPAVVLPVHKGEGNYPGDTNHFEEQVFMGTFLCDYPEQHLAVLQATVAPGVAAQGGKCFLLQARDMYPDRAGKVLGAVRQGIADAKAMGCQED